METALYDAQQIGQQLEIRKEKLEGENQELIVKQQNLKGKIYKSPSIAPIFENHMKQDGTQILQQIFCQSVCLSKILPVIISLRVLVGSLILSFAVVGNLVNHYFGTGIC